MFFLLVHGSICGEKIELYVRVPSRIVRRECASILRYLRMNRAVRAKVDSSVDDCLF
jgi:hypothetical protein